MPFFSFFSKTAEKGDGALDKRKKTMEKTDDGKKGKTKKSMKGKNDSSSDGTEESVTEKDNASLKKSENSIAEKNKCISNKTEMTLAEKDGCLFNENLKPTTDREISTTDKSKKDECMKRKYDKDESNARNLIDCIISVKVSKHDATKVQRELEGEMFDKFSEGCEVMNATKIPYSNLDSYLDYLQCAFEGIDNDVRTNINSALCTKKEWKSRMVEWNFKQPDDSGIIYGLIAFGRSKDQQYVDCMYVLYKMDFALTPHEIVTEKKSSWLFGLKTDTSLKVEFIDHHLDVKSIQDIQNFFRVKALEKIYKEGYIESINFVDSLDEISDSK